MPTINHESSIHRLFLPGTSLLVQISAPRSSRAAGGSRRLSLAPRKYPATASPTTTGRLAPLLQQTKPNFFKRSLDEDHATCIARRQDPWLPSRLQPQVIERSNEERIPTRLPLLCCNAYSSLGGIQCLPWTCMCRTNFTPQPVGCSF